MDEQKELLRYFMKETNKRFDTIERKLDDHANKSYDEIQRLKKFKFTWTGGIVVMNIIITAAMAYLIK